MGVVLVIAGLALLFYWRYLRKRAAATAGWPSVRGRVTQSQVRQVRSGSSYDDELLLAYAYQVGGAAYQCSRFSFGPMNPRNVAARYKVGAEVSVYYDPVNPSSAFLEHVKSSSAIIVLAMAAIFVVVGVVMAAGSARASANQANAYSHATDLYARGDYATARTAFEDLARKGSTESKVYLGVLYAKGQGVAQDFIEAQKWFILAGDAGRHDREEVAKGLTPAQQADAERRAAAWPATP